jgi:hypothetical protein
MPTTAMKERIFEILISVGRLVVFLYYVVCVREMVFSREVEVSRTSDQKQRSGEAEEEWWWVEGE